MVPPFDRMYELWYKKASEQYFSKAHSVFIRAPLQDGSIRLTSLLTFWLKFLNGFTEQNFFVDICYAV